MKGIENEGLSEKPIHLEHLTEAEAANLLWLSFQFSQGNEEMQELILKHIRSFSEKPAPIDIQKTVALFSNKNTTVPDEQGNIKLKLSANNAHATLGENSVPNQLAKISNYLKCLTEPTVNTPEDIKKIITDILDSDFLHLIKRGGRPDRLDSNTGDNTLKDKFFSFGVQYLLRDNNTANPIFNRLLTELRAVPFTEYDKIDLTFMLDIIEKYNKYHPATPVEQLVISTITNALNQKDGEPDSFLE